MINRTFLALLIVIFWSTSLSFGQVVYEHTSYITIYDFLDDMANHHLININSSVKPYSNKHIALKLKEVNEQKEILNKTQKEDLEFFLNYYDVKEGNKLFDIKRRPLFYYQDSLLKMAINPVVGADYFINGINDFYHRWIGGEVFGTIGKHFGFYTSLRDNTESKKLVGEEIKTQRMGVNYHSRNDYSEMRGGFTYDWNWGSVALIKDHLVWGNNYNGSNIFSGRTPSFAQLKLNISPVKWFDFNYVHGWLVSEEIDSLRSYTFQNGTRQVFYEKYLAANFFTFTPMKHLNISVGNSVVYSDIGIHPAYLIPVFFYKSIDHQQTGTMGQFNYTGQNAQMFLDVSSRQIKKLHLYSSLFIDEIGLFNIFDKSNQSNWLSFKLGSRFSNIANQNISLTAEYTRTNPITYNHFIPTTTFESNKYNLGHYLGDNARELYFSLAWKPIRGLNIIVDYLKAEIGTDYIYTGVGVSGLGLPFMDKVEWKNSTFTMKVKYELMNGVYTHISYSMANISGDSLNVYTPDVFRGKTNTISGGISYGF
ncbi:MAG: hypothetical protein COC01_09915 [Bacteroidetes bacterium]|nr:hypothetical protein [Bacteroidia bacterium]PCH65287.1 MAG: hypothetical protein COC01_09915 [Bacteroidota bacterium]